jgi:hypothetical protein
MRLTRSGAPPRLLPFRSPEHWAVRSELFVVNFLFGFLPLIIAVWALQNCGRAALGRLIDPRDPIHRIDQPLDQEEAARGVVRVGGKLTGSAEVCVVIHEYKTKDWNEDWRVTAGEGALIDVDSEAGRPLSAKRGPLAVAWEKVRWEPRVLAEESAREAFWRERFSAVPWGGRLREACLRPGDRVFLAGCADPSAPRGLVAADPPVGGCGDRLAVLTPGDGTPGPRIDQLAASASGEISLLGAAVLTVLLYGFRVAGARPFITALIRRLRPAPFVTVGTPALCVIGVAPIAFLITLALLQPAPGGVPDLQIQRHGYAVTYATLAGSVILGLLMRDRRRALAALIRSIDAPPPPSLAQASSGKRVALDAEVDPGAPLFNALLTGSPRAHWSVGVTRVQKIRRNYESSPEPDRRGPELLPIRSAMGDAQLDLTHAVVDVRAFRRIVRKRAIRRGDFQHILGEPQASDGLFVLEERFLDPGEAIYVEGQVQRFEAASSDARDKDPRAVPVIGGTSDEPIFVHAGSRRSLLGNIAAERRFLDIALGLALAVVAATLATTAYLIHL